MFQAWRMFVMFLGLQLGAARISTGSIHINSIKLVPTSGLPARVGRHWQRSIRRSFLHQSTCSSLQDRSLSCKNLSQLSHTNILLHLLPSLSSTLQSPSRLTWLSSSYHQWLPHWSWSGCCALLLISCLGCIRLSCLGCIRQRHSLAIFSQWNLRKSDSSPLTSASPLCQLTKVIATTYYSHAAECSRVTLELVGGHFEIRLNVTKSCAPEKSTTKRHAQASFPSWIRPT